MASLSRRFAAALLLGSFAVICASEGTAADDKVPDIETIMKKVNGKKGLTAKVKAASADAKWDDAAKSAKDIKDMTAALGKNPVPKGDKESWTKLTKKYADDGAAIADAVEKKDSKAVDAAVKAFSGGCKTCHDAHK